MPPIPLPFSEVQRRRFLRRFVVAAVTFGVLLDAGIYFGIHDLFRHSALAAALAAYVAVSVVVFVFVSTYSYFTADYQSRLAWRLIAGGMFGT
ncbi:MAG TPA: hypothetical protein VFI65_06875 [Streptosporangiaceae bacterium]|nr:hypothetical protein [Streptosporangiaceae bacterium]